MQPQRGAESPHWVSSARPPPTTCITPEPYQAALHHIQRRDTFSCLQLLPVSPPNPSCSQQPRSSPWLPKLPPLSWTSELAPRHRRDPLRWPETPATDN